MAADRERQRAVQEGVERARQFLATAPLQNLEEIEVASQPQNLAEVLALLAARSREAGSDEVLDAEITLRAVPCSRETLLEARRTLRALGYDKLGTLLKRMARAAPRKPAWFERMRPRTR